jgi:hypothetical protein
MGAFFIRTLFLHVKQLTSIPITGCISELGDFAILFFLVWQHWGGCRYRPFAANFKVF